MNITKQFLSIGLGFGLMCSLNAFSQSYEEIMSKRDYWPSQVKVIQEFESPLAEANGRKSTATFKPGHRLIFQGPYKKKPGYLLVKSGTSFALAPVGSTDLMEQATKNERMGRRTAVTAPKGGTSKGPARMEMKVVKGKGQRLDKSDYDNKSQNVVMRAAIKSREGTRTFQGVQAKIYVLGKSAAANMKDRAFQMVAYKEHTFDLLPGKMIEFESPPVALTFDDNASAKFGTKFYGYLLEIYEDGELIASQSSPSTLKKYAKTVRSQTVSGRYSSNYFQLK